MELIHKTGDLFEAPEDLIDSLKVDNVWHGRKHDIYYAHCVSADFALGAGIAKQFEKNFCLKRDLQKIPYKDRKVGSVHRVGTVFNLITKERYFEKPTLVTLADALRSLKQECIKRRVKNLVIPKIGCGLDKLQWIFVEDLIRDIFHVVDIRIFVYTLPKEKRTAEDYI